MVPLFKAPQLQISGENLHKDYVQRLASKVNTSIDIENSQCSLPQFKRQFAIDVPATTFASKRPTPAIVFSTDNSFDSSRTYTGSTLQKNRQDQWSSRQPSSIASSAHSNGNLPNNEIKKSRKSSLLEIKNKTRRRFSICLLYTSPSPRD